MARQPGREGPRGDAALIPPPISNAGFALVFVICNRDFVCAAVFHVLYSIYCIKLHDNASRLSSAFAIFINLNGKLMYE